METIVLPVIDLLVLGTLIEAMIEIVKPLFPKKLSAQGIMVISMVLGIALSLTLDVSIFANVDQSVITIGSVMAGMIASRGSNFIHDFISAMTDIGKTK